MKRKEAGQLLTSPLTLKLLRTALEDPSIADFDLSKCERPWGGVDGQAVVERVRIHRGGASQGGTETVVLKHARVPPKEKHSAAKADEKLKSFHVESEFLRLCCPILTAKGLAVPQLIFGEHNNSERTSLMLMTDMATNYDCRPVYLNRGSAEAALTWLGGLHASFWGADNVPPSLWRSGSWWDLRKVNPRNNCTVATMASNWERSVAADPDLEAVISKFPAVRRLPQRLANAAEAVEGRVYARLKTDKDPGRCREVQTLIHGDFKSENLFFAGVPQQQRCATVDFQWVGRGCPAVDLVYLFVTSLKPGLMESSEDQLLNHYFYVLKDHGIEYDKPLLQRQYELCLIDFARFVLADGPVTGSRFLDPVLRASELLARIDGGNIRSPEEYHAALLNPVW